MDVSTCSEQSAPQSCARWGGQRSASRSSVPFAPCWLPGAAPNLSSRRWNSPPRRWERLFLRSLPDAAQTPPTAPPAKCLRPPRAVGPNPLGAAPHFPILLLKYIFGVLLMENAAVGLLQTKGSPGVVKLLIKQSLIVAIVKSLSPWPAFSSLLLCFMLLPGSPCPFPLGWVLSSGCRARDAGDPQHPVPAHAACPGTGRWLVIYLAPPSVGCPRTFAGCPQPFVLVGLGALPSLKKQKGPFDDGSGWC